MIDHDEIAADLLRNIGELKRKIAALEPGINTLKAKLDFQRDEKKHLETEKAALEIELKERMIENGIQQVNTWNWNAHTRHNAPITTIVDEDEAIAVLRETDRLKDCIQINWPKATTIFAAMPEPPPGTERVASTSLVVKEVKHE